MSSDDAFLRAIKDNPADNTPRLAYAAWLEERGDPRAELIRLMHDPRYSRDRADERGQRLRELILAGVRPCGPTVVNSIGMPLALIPPGEFWLGSPSQEPGRRDDEAPIRVGISRPFYLGVFPVTQAEYERLTGRKPSCYCYATGERSRATPDRFPVESVSWEDAIAFCSLLSALPEERGAGRVYRLPTEAEWEYSCRGGIDWDFWLFEETTRPPTPFFYGPSLSGLACCHWLTSEGVPESPEAVGCYVPNAFGLYDMHGNVYEWCFDWYEELYGGDRYWPDPARCDLQDQQVIWGRSKQDLRGPASGIRRVRRGGSWICDEAWCRSAARDAATPGHRDDETGFRIACDVVRTLGIPAAG